jgi:hypothetical protein
MNHSDDKKDYLIAKNRLKDKNDPVLSYKEAATLLKKNGKHALMIRLKKEENKIASLYHEIQGADKSLLNNYKRHSYKHLPAYNKQERK